MQKRKCNKTSKCQINESIENPMNKFDVNIVTNRKKYLNWSFRSTFTREKQFANGIIMIEKYKCRIKLKLTHKEAGILELYKVSMYDFHCNYIKNNRVTKLNLC